MSIKIRQLLLFQLLGLIVIGSLGVTWLLSVYFPNIKIVNESLNATLNVIGTGIGVAAIISTTFQEQSSKDDSKLYLLSIGLLIMGVFRFFDAVSDATNTTIFLKNIGYLAGSFFFMLTYIPELDNYLLIKKSRFALFVFTASVLLGLCFLSYPDASLTMVNDTKFTRSNIVIYSICGIIFIFSSLGFLYDFFKNDKLESYFISSMCILFGLSGVLVFYSSLWNPVWWLRNILSAIAYLIAGVFIIKAYLNNYANVKFAVLEHERMQEIVNEVKEWNQLVFDSANEAFISFDTNGLIQAWNHKAEKTFAWLKPEVLEKKTIEDIIFLPEIKETNGNGNNIYDKIMSFIDKKVELTALHRDGYKFPVESIFHVVRIRNAIRCFVFLHDVTELKQNEKDKLFQLTLGKILAKPPITSEAMTKLLKVICETTKWSIGEFWEVDQKCNVLRCAEVWYEPTLMPTEFIAESKQIAFSPGAGVLGQVWTSGNHLLATSLAMEENLKRKEILKNLKLSSNFAFPIKASNKILGVLSFFSSEVKIPDEHLTKIILNTCDRVGELIQYTKLEELIKIKA
ncbi:MAG: PAS domain S-box protein [Candidatus Melainabacteria bacterium]|nr:PAS domain S-box protein [Candidatus Melainabacteria bacterium]